MKLLAIDTAGTACSAALLCAGRLTERVEVAPRRHGELLLGMMDELLQAAGISLTALDALAFGRGPGAFTGVRIASAVAQGAAFGAGLPVIGVSNLAALAQAAWQRWGARRIAAALDARMGEVYWGTYWIDDAGLARAADGEQVSVPDQVRVPAGGDWWGVGSGWGVQQAALAAHFAADRTTPSQPTLIQVEPDLVATARDLLPLAVADWGAGQAAAAGAVLPVYLRDRVAEPPRR
ncbi:MAG: tRNA (adenosine(37)-N6)-threonylcarbamoyltransferase complex dimerization subunit type 1 TsaB [Chromatiaceae bacterium]|nr:MAG: tRNA (adenosine(37)-N6)-threonylcarbamoyltransferase complex dimerization subunit type 1 TsaB [Chromatiaceae bacterium]